MVCLHHPTLPLLMVVIVTLLLFLLPSTSDGGGTSAITLCTNAAVGSIASGMLQCWAVALCPSRSVVVVMVELG